jgi:serine/threonine-protein kinase
LVLVAALLVGAGLTVHHWGELPERMASHFDASGHADGWMSKAGFFVLFGLSFASVTLVPAVIARFAPRFPDSLVNLPNKAYWLAPERRAETFGYIARWLLWLGAVSALLFTWLLSSTIEANLQGAEQARLGGETWWAFGLYLGYVAAATTALVVHFFRRRQALG